LLAKVHAVAVELFQHIVECIGGVSLVLMDTVAIVVVRPSAAACDANVGVFTPNIIAVPHLEINRTGFTAAVALGVDAKELTCHVDSVSFCLSKGLAAPVGSVICGSGDFIAEARRNRKVLGGGMRQCGIIAAAGITALEQMVERLTQDHANARRLAEGISRIPGLSIDLENIRTNIVYFNLEGKKLTADAVIERLAERGIKILNLGPALLRAVTHYGVTADDIDLALDALGKIMIKS